VEVDDVDRVGEVDLGVVVGVAAEVEPCLERGLTVRSLFDLPPVSMLFWS